LRWGTPFIPAKTSSERKARSAFFGPAAADEYLLTKRLIQNIVSYHSLLKLQSNTNKLAEDRMVEPINTTEPATKEPTGVVGKIVKYVVLALLVMTCIMAAYRKFGG
jgi:hypothetical protein